MDTKGERPGADGKSRLTARRTYANPPVQEAVLQLKWAQPIPWSVATPGRVFTALHREYPQEPEEQHNYDADLQFSSDAGPRVSVTNTHTRILYKSQVGNRTLMAAPDFLAVSSLAPYEGWGNMRMRLKGAVETLSQSGIISSGGFPLVASVGLRYINQFILPEDVETGRFFNLGYPVPAAHGAGIRNFMTRVESLLPGGIQCATGFARTLQNGAAVYLLDIDLTHPLAEAMPADKALSKEIAGELKELEAYEFESAITDSARERFM